MLYKRLPVLNWLPKYNMEWAIGDFVAGITVGLTVIPQALAYSNIAGLSPQVSHFGTFNFLSGKFTRTITYLDFQCLYFSITCNL